MFLDIDSFLIPTGDILNVADHKYMDFSTPKAIGRDISQGTVTPAGNASIMFRYVSFSIYEYILVHEYILLHEYVLLCIIV